MHYKNDVVVKSIGLLIMNALYFYYVILMHLFYKIWNKILFFRRNNEKEF